MSTEKSSARRPAMRRTLPADSTGVRKSPKPSKRDTRPLNGKSDEACEQAAASTPRGTSASGGEKKLTTIQASVDVGFGNQLFVRGQGDGLTWDKGQPLSCVAPSLWVWTTESLDHKLVFKLLLNDEIWSQGDDCTVPAGEQIKVAPRF